RVRGPLPGPVGLDPRPPTPPAEGPRPLPGHARRFARHRLAKVIGAGVAAALAFGVAGATTAAIRITGNIDAVDANRIMEDHGIQRPEVPDPVDPNAGQPLNILVMGSDYRGEEEDDDDVEGQRADSTMILHLSADRSRAYAVSIPRDTIVDVPSCPTTSDIVIAPRSGVRFNAAFALGYDIGGDVGSAAICTMTTVEQFTNIRLDGYIVMDFIAFRNMIDALGTVTVYIDRPINDRMTGLRLDPGYMRMGGTTALKYARARYGIGDGSDLQRIERQQGLMMGIVNEVLGSNLLLDTPRLLRFLAATTDSMSMSSNFASINGLAGLGFSLRNIRPTNIEFEMAPIAINPANHNTVIFTADAERVWTNLRHGWPLDTPDGGPVAAGLSGPADPSDSTEEASQ
ncbi:MAG: LCP family protein, partial [Promicromonosporaceae bacterium]|nr:LCP family protein [Promicromonosporaceae bacterium]